MLVYYVHYNNYIIRTSATALTAHPCPGCCYILSPLASSSLLTFPANSATFSHCCWLLKVAKVVTTSFFFLLGGIDTPKLRSVSNSEVQQQQPRWMLAHLFGKYATIGWYKSKNLPTKCCKHIHTYIHLCIYNITTTSNNMLIINMKPTSKRSLGRWAKYHRYRVFVATNKSTECLWIHTLYIYTYIHINHT